MRHTPCSLLGTSYLLPIHAFRSAAACLQCLLIPLLCCSMACVTSPSIDRMCARRGAGWWTNEGRREASVRTGQRDADADAGRGGRNRWWQPQTRGREMDDAQQVQGLQMGRRRCSAWRCWMLEMKELQQLDDSPQCSVVYPSTARLAVRVSVAPAHASVCRV